MTKVQKMNELYKLNAVKNSEVRLRFVFVLVCMHTSFSLIIYNFICSDNHVTQNITQNVTKKLNVSN